MIAEDRNFSSAARGKRLTDLMPFWQLRAAAIAEVE
jgi:hypothetical protein